ncbi:MAG: hypothetical protein AAF614_16580 [Chloroflexota bacterium]
MNKILEKLNEISEDSPYGCGGTYSSWRLRACLKLTEEVAAFTTHPDCASVYSEIIQVTEIWREQLKRHNSQNLKFTVYDLETGMPLESDLMEPIVLKPSDDLK